MLRTNYRATRKQPSSPVSHVTDRSRTMSSHWHQSLEARSAVSQCASERPFSSCCRVRAQWDHIPVRCHGNNPEVLPREGKKWEWEAVIKQGVVRFVFPPPCTSFYPCRRNHFAPPGKENFLAGSESKRKDEGNWNLRIEKEKLCKKKKSGGLSAVISWGMGLPSFLKLFLGVSSPN
jgi:hypothetical protein